MISPLLTPKAIDLLQSCLSPAESDLWEELGAAWTTSWADWTGEAPLPYQPTFYDGWQLPEPSDQAPSRYQDSPPLQPVEPALRMQVLYEFEARNSQELTVTQGEVLEVLDKSKRWWLDEETGQRAGRGLSGPRWRRRLRNAPRSLPAGAGASEQVPRAQVCVMLPPWSEPAS